MQMNLEFALALASGIVVAAATGLRAFLPLLALGVAGRLGWVDLQPSMQWLGGTPALVCFGVAALIEIAADKIPVVDHAVDAVATIVRPVAGFMAGFAVLAHWPAPWAQIAAIAFGSGALAVHALKAKARLGSTAMTLGHANPLLSVSEDATAFLLLAAAILLPLAALALCVVMIVVLARRQRPARQPA